MISVLYEDSFLIVVEKPAGIESQSARGFEQDMVSLIRSHIHKLSPKDSTAVWDREPPYVGVIHRLDRPVRGVMVYAKTKKAAALLSRQVQDGRIKKIYRAVVCGKPVDNCGTYVDFLLKDGKSNASRIVDKLENGGKIARLNYKVVDTKAAGMLLPDQPDQLLSLVEVELLTGRHHQIRVQMAGHGTPLFGDGKYGAGAGSGKRGAEERKNKSLPAGPLALCAVRLSFDHPETGKRMIFEIKETGGAFDLF